MVIDSPVPENPIRQLFQLISLKGINFILLFVVLFSLSFLVYVYLVPREGYITAENLTPSFFPIAIVENGTPKIIRWDKYQKNSTGYKNSLLANPVKDAYFLENGDHFYLEKKTENYFSLYIEHYSVIHESEYEIVDDQIKPKRFRAQMVFPELRLPPPPRN